MALGEEDDENEDDDILQNILYQPTTVSTVVQHRDKRLQGYSQYPQRLSTETSRNNHPYKNPYYDDMYISVIIYSEIRHHQDYDTREGQT